MNYQKSPELQMSLAPIKMVAAFFEDNKLEPPLNPEEIQGLDMDEIVEHYNNRYALKDSVIQMRADHARVEADELSSQVQTSDIAARESADKENKDAFVSRLYRLIQNYRELKRVADNSPDVQGATDSIDIAFIISFNELCEEFMKKAPETPLANFVLLAIKGELNPSQVMSFVTDDSYWQDRFPSLMPKKKGAVQDTEAEFYESLPFEQPDWEEPI